MASDCLMEIILKNREPYLEKFNIYKDKLKAYHKTEDRIIGAKRTLKSFVILYAEILIDANMYLTKEQLEIDLASSPTKYDLEEERKKQEIANRNFWQKIYHYFN